MNQNMNFKIQPPSTFVFLVFYKSELIKSCSSFHDLSAYKISWPYVDGCKFCIHPRSLNVHHPGSVESTGLKVCRCDHLLWNDLSTKFHKNLLIDSEIRGDIQTEF
jgi:hypothetical protein